MPDRISSLTTMAPPDHHAADAFDAQWWEQHYQQADLAAVADPTPYVVALAAARRPGTVLDAGCGTGTDARWLAGQGWTVTAVDISPSAIEQARRLTDHAGVQVDWLVGDAGKLAVDQEFDVVISQYVHPHGPFGAFVRQLADAVAPTGHLLIVGHEHGDQHSAEHAPRDASIGIEAITEQLDPEQWQVEIADVRTRQVGAMTLLDTIVRARRRS